VDMEMDASGDFYITGQATVTSARYGTIKLRGSDGLLLWEALDSRQSRNYPADLSLDGRGGVYITGRTDPDGDQSNQNDNFYSVKRNAADGSLVWTHDYGANCIYCLDLPAGILTDSAGNTFLMGLTSSPPYAGDMIVLVLNSATGAENMRSVVDGGTPWQV
jgi:hypothetical protein